LEADSNHKFMQTVGEKMYRELERIATEKGIRVQTLLRAVIIPEWVQRHGLSSKRKNIMQWEASQGLEKGSGFFPAD